MLVGLVVGLGQENAYPRQAGLSHVHGSQGDCQNRHAQISPSHGSVSAECLVVRPRPGRRSASGSTEP